MFQKDLEYWQIDELILEPCCALKYYPGAHTDYRPDHPEKLVTFTFSEIELCVKEQKGEQEAKMKENQRLADENFGNSRSSIS